MEGEWSCYRGGLFNGVRMVMLQRWSLMEEEWSGYRSGQFNGGRMVICMLWRWSVLDEGEWLCYRSSLFNGGGIVVMEVASLKEGEWSSGQFNRGSMVMLQRWPV